MTKMAKKNRKRKTTAQQLGIKHIKETEEEGDLPVLQTPTPNRTPENVGKSQKKKKKKIGRLPIVGAIAGPCPGKFLPEGKKKKKNFLVG